MLLRRLGFCVQKRICHLQQNTGRFHKPFLHKNDSLHKITPLSIRCFTKEGAEKEVEATLSTNEGERVSDIANAPWQQVPLREPEMRLVVYNISKSNNLGTIARSASLLGIREIVCVGRQKWAFKGNQGTLRSMKVSRFYSIDEAVKSLKEEGFDFVGVEITPDAFNVASHPFRRKTAFILGNEGSGLSERVLELCDYTVYIPQFNQTQACLNVSVSGAIVFHHFAEWAKYEESPRDPSGAHKFQTTRTKGRTSPTEDS